MGLRSIGFDGLGETIFGVVELLHPQIGSEFGSEMVFHIDKSEHERENIGARIAQVITEMARYAAIDENKNRELREKLNGDWMRFRGY
ncbi:MULTISPECIES: hypothetical protein [unclassified Bradyrhizobium]|uniref:hypothetical protein n=1 Tax=unclassified Bradyrhizobium TaxID=2631580 RepID=UPI002916D45D|nr:MULTISPECIES: hypothetical protein [unclassified Bradyrhizobium]